MIKTDNEGCSNIQMNLVDVEELKYNLREIMPEIGENCVADEMYNVVATMPTIDAENVRHARWIWDEGEYEYVCPVCNCHFDYDTTYGVFDHGGARYCPNCGAKMDDEG